MGGVRASILIGAGLMLTACTETMTGPVTGPATGVMSEVPSPSAEASLTPPEPEVVVDPTLAAIYAARRDGERSITAVDVAKFDSEYLRRQVAWDGPEVPGTLVIETGTRHLYLVEEAGTATRYGVAIGSEGFGWTGEGRIARRAHWPRWTPPPEMIERDPALAEWRDGMPGGPDNPLGARALYIYFGEHDSQYRVHGTNQPFSIGRAASAGCFRMLNQDVIDLYARVEPDARIVVR